jgi:hypothetical protein
MAVVRRLERFRMQAAARSLLPGERVSFCLRRVRPGEPGVKVWKGATSAHYSGAMTCASVWVCPVCASKISERRRGELLKGLAAWKARGGRVLMLTQTIPHYAHQGVQEVLERFSRARALLRNRKPWKALARALRLRGSVRALEVTHGANGWHVHSHELLFLEGAAPSGEVLQNGEIAARVLPEWKRACLDAGLSEPNEHGIQVDHGDEAGRYAAKWGADLELTKGHIKRGREGNRSPWDLLREVMGEELEPGEISAAGELFQDYARAFKGRRQLTWSRGLRELLGLELEESDEEVAAQVEEGAVLLGCLTRSEWGLVVAADQRGELLEVANREGWEGVVQFVRRLRVNQGGKADGTRRSEEE